MGLDDYDGIMDDSIQKIKEQAKKILTSISCDFGEIRFSSSLSTTITLSGKNIDTMSSGNSIGGSVRILNNGTWGFVSFNDLHNIENFIKEARDISLQFTPEEKTGLFPYDTIVDAYSTKMEKDFRKISIDEKYELIQKYNLILENSPSIQTTRATYRDIFTRYHYFNSIGSDVSYDKAYCGISLSAIARDGAIIQPFHESTAGYHGFEHVENREGIAEGVTKTAVDLLKAESVDGGNYTVVIDPKLAGVFIHEAFGHLSEADFVHENKEMQKIMVLGKEFGPQELNVVDNGTLPGLSGYIPIDDEGVTSQKTDLIKNGILSGRLHSKETAYKMNESPTGNARAISVMSQPIVRMTNTYIENGSSSKEEIFDSVDSGLYAIDNIGGQTNLEMFTFSSGYGYEIKNGKKGKMLKDIVLSGNVFTTLKNITKIGNDKKLYGGLGGCGKGGQSPLPVSFGGPHILIENVLIGGKQ